MADDRKDPRELLANMLAMELYVIVTEPLRSPEIAAGLYEHLERQIDLEKRGILFGAGPLQDEGSDEPTRGMIVIRATSFAEAREIADSEPFHAAGIRTYTLHKWSLNEGSMTFTVNYSDRSVRVT